MELRTVRRHAERVLAENRVAIREARRQNLTVLRAAHESRRRVRRAVRILELWGYRA